MKRERDQTFSYSRETNFLRYKQFYLERDILRTAYSLFEAEKRLKVTGSIGSVRILLSQQTARRIDVPRLKAVLEELILLILLEDVEVELVEEDDMVGRVRKRAPFPSRKAIVLFSAGVDSYAGVRVAASQYDELLAVFVAHNDQSRIINIVEKIRPLIKTPIRTLYAPAMGSTGYSQLRGFVYVLAGGVYANLCSATSVLVTECGPTMYQPLFSTYDSITHTTHPYALKAAKDVLDVFLESRLSIIIPFEDMTKAEVIANSGISDFSMTHSCISSRFADHDGSCFGCVIKRIASLVSGGKDVVYACDVFATGTNQDNLMNLLHFSDDLISRYGNMPLFQTDTIEEFSKQDLFLRYALDNLAGLMLGVSKKHPLYRQFVSDESVLRQRIVDVRARKKLPDFSKRVI